MATGIKDKVAIIGMGCTRFGERWDMGAEELMVEAFQECLEDAGIEKKDIGAAWLGNPHALLIRDTLEDADIPSIGAWLGRQAAFPEGVNAGFAVLRNRNEIDLRVVERGAGETLACGSGACAAVAILRRFDRVDERVDVFLPGGRLVIQWPGTAAPLSMKGPAEHVFRGIMNE